MKMKKIALVGVCFFPLLASCSEENTKQAQTISSTTASASDSVPSKPKVSDFSVDSEEAHGLNEPGTVFINGKPAVTIEILKASTNPEDIVKEKDITSHPIDTLIRLDIRMTNHSVPNFNENSKSYRNFEIHTDDNTFVFPSSAHQPEGEPDVGNLSIGESGTVESYFVLENRNKTADVQELTFDYYYLRDLVNANSQDFRSLKFSIPVSH